MTDNKNLGNWGEKIAKSYLINSGYSFISENYQVGRQEIDLIFYQKKTLVFIEVKTRIENKDSLLENSLSAKQTKSLEKAIIEYCLAKHLSLDKVRLDLINIFINRKKRCAQLRHYKNIL